MRTVEIDRLEVRLRGIGNEDPRLIALAIGNAVLRALQSHEGRVSAIHVPSVTATSGLTHVHVRREVAASVARSVASKTAEATSTSDR